jgi:hypothetical protein
MKPTPSLPRTATVAKTAAGADAEAKVWHPTLVDFNRGVEVTEVLDSLPGELLELFKPAPPTGSR